MTVEDIRVNNVSFTFKDTIKLSAAENDLLIELKDSSKDSDLYQYSLSKPGKPPVWIQSRYPSAHFQGLEGGFYLFQIKKDKESFRIFINKKYSFMQSWWFWPVIIFYGLLLVGLGLYLFFLYDFRQKLKMQHVRNKIASDLHDEVGSNLNSIAIFIELLRKKIGVNNHELLPILDKITDNSDETVVLMRDTVWAISPLNDSSEKLFEKMRSFGFEMMANKDIAFEFKSPLKTDGERLSMDQRRNLYLIYKEAINNISKHAHATKASCSIETHKDQLAVTVADNGLGFDVAQTFEGNGLNNYRLRSVDEDINVAVESVKGKGTKIKITVFF